MRIALAADHAGYELKDELAAWLREAGHEVTDLGTNGPESVDYPQFGAMLAEEVASGRAERAIAVWGCRPGRGGHCRLGLGHRHFDRRQSRAAMPLRPGRRPAFGAVGTRA